MTSARELPVHDAHLAELDPVTLYRLLALRGDVFVVEQNCVYRDLDGRELEDDARLVWIADGDDVLATLRLLVDTDGSVRVGRVATAASARGLGLAARLMQRALELAADRVVVLDAQTYLVEWYERFGFGRVGDDFVDDGILHTPMRRPA